jgi:hypothetical protein
VENGRSYQWDQDRFREPSAHPAYSADRKLISALLNNVERVNEFGETGASIIEKERGSAHE